MDVIVSLLLCSQFIWFCFLSLLTNYCLRGKKCSDPLSQSDLFSCSGCSFIKSSSLLAATAPSKFLISTKLLFTTVSSTEHDCSWQQDWIKQLTSLYSQVLVSWRPNSVPQWKTQSRIWTREWEHLTGKVTTGYLSCTEVGKIQSVAASLDQQISNTFSHEGSLIHPWGSLTLISLPNLGDGNLLCLSRNHSTNGLEPKNFHLWQLLG